MRYELAKLPLRELFAPTSSATAALVRLDERIARSPLGEGWVARSHFSDACACLWVDGELVHVEDLVLHDAGMGVRMPTHELTIASDVLRTRRRILSHPPGWALSAEGLRRLRQGEGDDEWAPETKARRDVGNTLDDDEPDEDDPLARELAAIDAVLARSEALLNAARDTSSKVRRERDPLVYEPDWNEDERIGEWNAVITESADLPPVLRAALLLDAWNELQVLEHAPWLGRLLAAALLREAGLTAAHLLTFSLGLKQVPRARRGDRDRTVRLLAMIDAVAQAADMGMREHDRLVLARQQMQHRLVGRRGSSKLPQLIDLVLSRPMVSAGMIAETLKVSPQGALRIAGELNLRELTGRERFRAWGVL